MKNTTQSEFDGVEREEMHLRNIEMRGFRRKDGLFEVEGRMQDTKNHDFNHPTPGRKVAAGGYIHDMGVRIIFDETMLVHAITTFTTSAPYITCPEGGMALQQVVGLRMAGGWSKEVSARLRGAASCTHLRELLIPLATTAHQTLGLMRIQEPVQTNAQGRPLPIDSCYGYAADGMVVATRWPQFHIQPASSSKE